MYGSSGYLRRSPTPRRPRSDRPGNRGVRPPAGGLSNREIGARLHISGNTAANHVRSILTKTGAANRTQAAMYAATHEIV